jgi:hypothetical protein
MGDDNVCLQSCDSDADCRTPLYECFDYDSDGTDECAPVGSGDGAIGDACDSVADCGGGQRGFCALEGMGIYSGGYCLMTCGGGESCPVGSNCTGTSGGSFCMRNCESDADCRSPGYMCRDFDDDGSRECTPAGTGDNGIGEPCDGVWDCAGGGAGLCYNESAGFPEGMCSRTCVLITNPCGEGYHCAYSDASSEPYFCLVTCEIDADCREGYECRFAVAEANPFANLRECVPAGW